MNNARPKARPGMGTPFTLMVDDALSPARLQAMAHPQDWPEDSPDQGGNVAEASALASAPLPRATWEGALGEIARDILGRPSRQFRGRMCELAWRLADGDDEIPANLPAVVEVIHAGSLIVDDIEDGSPVRRGGPSLHVVHGIPRALNTGNWMYFWAMDLVAHLDLPALTRDGLRRALVDAMYRCHRQI